jgi:transcriptional regulator with XRE-family HTH domain
MAKTNEETQEWVNPDGLSIRRFRHARKWSPREFVTAIGRAHHIATGLTETISPNLLQHIEEKNERIPYKTLCMIARGLDCDPTDLLAE